MKTKNLSLLVLLFALPAAADVSGVWSGAFHAVGGDGDIPQLITIKQTGANLTGSGGPDAKEQYPIVGGMVQGDSVKFEIRTPQREFWYDMKVNGKKLRGTILIKSPKDTRTADVWLEHMR